MLWEGLITQWPIFEAYTNSVGNERGLCLVAVCCCFCHTLHCDNCYPRNYESKYIYFKHKMYCKFVSSASAFKVTTMF